MHGIMHITLGLSLLGALAAAAPAPQGQWRRVTSRAPGTAGFVLARQANGTAPPPPGGNSTPSDTQIRNAVMGWMKDTGKVTQFMNTATSFTGDEYTRQAQIALNAELDELNHKKILDAGLGNNPQVQAANEVLENQGTFQNVVNVLQNMVDNGPDTAQADVDAINNNRCVNVLPNIDAYFAAAGMPEVSAVRPTGCLEVQGPPTALPPPVAQNPNNNNQGENQGNNQGNVTEAPAQATQASSSLSASRTARSSTTSASREEAAAAEPTPSGAADADASAEATSSALAEATDAAEEEA